MHIGIWTSTSPSSYVRQEKDIPHMFVRNLRKIELHFTAELMNISILLFLLIFL